MDWRTIEKKIIMDIEKILESDDPEPEKLEQVRSMCRPDGDGRIDGFAQVARRYFEAETGMDV